LFVDGDRKYMVIAQGCGSIRGPIGFPGGSLTRNTQ